MAALTAAFALSGGQAFAEETGESGILAPFAPFGIFHVQSAGNIGRGNTGTVLAVERGELYRFSGLLSYGVTDTVDVGLGVPYVTEGEENRSGAEDVAAALRQRIVGESRFGPSVSYILMSVLDSASSGLDTGGGYGGGLLITKRVGPVNGHANVIYKEYADESVRDEFNFAAGFDFSAAHDFRILGEALGRTDDELDGLENLEIRLGYRFQTGRDFWTAIGVGTDVKDKTPGIKVMLSFSALFRASEPEMKRIYEEE